MGTHKKAKMVQRWNSVWTTFLNGLKREKVPAPFIFLKKENSGHKCSSKNSESPDDVTGKKLNNIAFCRLGY